MRLVSQDGLIDVCYDNIALQIIKSNMSEETSSTCVIYGNANDFSFYLAKYNSEEEALNVVERIYQSYTHNRPYFKFPQIKSIEKE